MTTKHTFVLTTAVLLAALVGACVQAIPTPTPEPTATPVPTDTPTPAVTEEPAIQQWDQPPEMTIDPEKIYLATLKTEKGDIKIELFAARAPKTVNNFIFLARAGFYDNTTFHRVLPDFVAQGGDPTGTGRGGPGYFFEDELDPTLRFDDAGYLAMANAGPNTNGSQFFITYAPAPWLNGRHTIFGKVVEGMEVLQALTPRDPMQNPDYPGDTLKTVEIEVIAESLLPPPTPTPEPIAPQPEEGRPLARLEIAARENLYNSAPEMVIDPTRAYTATISTTQGDIVVALDAESAPQSVNNFVVLANLGYWDGFPIVYVEPDLFVLTGSPAGRPNSDVGYGLTPEVKLATTAGAVGYWFRPDYFGSSGSQFFILMVDEPRMTGQFTVFGRVVEGLEVVKALTTEDTVTEITVAEQP